MKKLLLTTLLLAASTTALAVDNQVEAVDSPQDQFQCESYAPVEGSLFVIKILDDSGQITEAQPQSAFGDGHAVLITKQVSPLTTQYKYQLSNGAQLIFVKKVFVGRGGGRGGRGGFDTFPVADSLPVQTLPLTYSAKLITENETLYFNCN